MDTASSPEEILFRWEDDFAEDFEFVDIQVEAVNSCLFTEHECNTILSYSIRRDAHSMRREQVKKMFTILVDGKKNLNVFVEVLTEKYDWLADKLQREMDRVQQSDEMKSYRILVESLRGELPKHFDSNVKRTKHVSCYYSNRSTSF